MNQWAEVLLTTLTALLGGGVGAAIIGAANDRWKFKAKRQADREDQAAEIKSLREREDKRKEENDRRLREIEKQNAAQSEALKLILLDRVLYLGKGYINAGEITYDDRRRFHAMHDCYHTGLGGNGDADLIVESVDELPIKCR